MYKRDLEIDRAWAKLLKTLEQLFGKTPENVEAILFLIGVNELGQGVNNFSKEEKQDLMHIAICRLLEPLGYYEFEFIDDDGWPHYKVKEALPFLKPGEQSVMMKEAIVNYFLEKGLI
jgi:hypothetical protein